VVRNAHMTLALPNRSYGILAIPIQYTRDIADLNAFVGDISHFNPLTASFNHFTVLSHILDFPSCALLAYISRIAIRPMHQSCRVYIAIATALSFSRGFLLQSL